MSFEPSAYGPVLGPLLETDRRRPLDAGVPDRSATGSLRELTIDTAFRGNAVVDASIARCCLSGLWLLYDCLDESHSLSQSISTKEGSFWHGVMHRREGDYSNAKYWFRNVGGHPVYDLLAERFGEWDPYDFVDRCQAAVRQGHDAETCLEAQQAEWEALFDWCWNGAVGR